MISSTPVIEPYKPDSTVSNCTWLSSQQFHFSSHQQKEWWMGRHVYKKASDYHKNHKRYQKSFRKGISIYDETEFNGFIALRTQPWWKYCHSQGSRARGNRWYEVSGAMTEAGEASVWKGKRPIDEERDIMSRMLIKLNPRSLFLSLGLEAFALFLW